MLWRRPPDGAEAMATAIEFREHRENGRKREDEDDEKKPLADRHVRESLLCARRVEFDEAEFLRVVPAIELRQLREVEVEDLFVERRPGDHVVVQKEEKRPRVMRRESGPLDGVDRVL